MRFRSHIDGSLHMLTPERAVDIQAQLGSDIMMALDHLIGLPAKPRKMLDATLRTHRWLDRCIAALAESYGHARGVLFGICQGGMDPDLRRLSAQYVAAADVSGIAIGGLSVGETKAEMAEMLDVVVPELPEGKPRYLMGVGSPGRPLERSGARRRHVRLRPADPVGAQRFGLHTRRAHRSPSSEPSGIVRANR
ncbi:MAG: tRNA guanosine(34) transglycosylase Tgt [Thermomicrobiales bacterium]